MNGKLLNNNFLSFIGDLPGGKGKAVALPKLL
jgi:hypothetical protein